MSGFLALAADPGRAVDSALLEGMTGTLRFRGPDGLGVRPLGRAGLGHALLALEDAVPQPRSLDGRAWIAGDVRLDARDELVGALAAMGAPVDRATPDCDLLLHGYRTWGPDCLERLSGAFAFALWDAHEERLLCARDPLGVRPLFFARIPGGIVVSNTLRTIRHHPEVGDALDETAIADFLLFVHKQDPEATAYRDIRRVPPGHRLLWREAVPDVRPWWRLESIEPVEYPRPEDYVDRYRELLRAAVEDRTRVERVRILMSGGLDSTSVAAFARRLSADTGRPRSIEALTVVYDRLIPDEERRFAGLAAAHLGIPIHIVPADEYDLFQGLDGRAPTPEPDPSPLPGLGSLFDGGGARVALHGMGPDFLLRRPAGHLTGLVRRFRWIRIARESIEYVRLHRRRPRLGLLRQVVRRVAPRRVEGQRDGIYLYRLPPWISPGLVSDLDLAERVASMNEPPPIPDGPRPWANRAITGDAIATQLFEPSDPGWTGRPIQYRYPHMDLRLTRFLAAVPFAEWQRGKGLLRLVVRDMLPPSIANRPKTALRGDPTPILLRRRNPFAAWQPVPGLERFVDLERFDLSEASADLRDGLDTQLWLQVYSLNEWLRRAS